MPDRDLDKTKEELVLEVKALRQRVNEMELRRLTRSQSSWVEAEDLYLSLIAEALFGYYVIQDGRFHFVNPKMVEIFGYTVEEMLEKVVPLDVIHPSDRKAAADIIKLRLDGVLGSATHNLKCLRKDGSTVYIQATSSRIRYRGKPALHGTILDITERIKFERDLLKSESRYRGIVEDQTELICRFLSDGTLTFVNQAFCRYFGGNPSQLVGRSFLTKAAEKDRRLFWETISRLDHTNPVTTVEHRMVFPGGHTRWQQWTIRAIFDEFTRPIEFQGVGRDITEQKLAEEALVQSETNLRHQVDYLNTLMQSLNELFFTYDLEGYMTFINQKSEEVLGYKSHELLGTNVIEYVPENIRKPVIEGMQRILKDGHSLSDEIPVYRKDGSLRIVRLNSAPIIEDGTITGAMVLGEDITERKKTEAALRASESNLQKQVNYLNTLIDNLNELFFTYDTDARITMVNKKSWEILGIKPEAMLGRKVISMIMENDREVITQEIKARLLYGRSGSYEVAVHHQDGSIRQLRLNASPIIEDGRGVGGMVLAEDITERKRTEEALAAEKEWLAVTLRSIGEGVITTDTKGSILLINDVAEKLTGWNQCEVVGKPIEEVLSLLHPQTREPQPWKLIERLQTRAVIELANQVLVCRDGQERIIDASGARIRDRSENFIGAVLVFRDITDRLRIEQEMIRTSKLESLGVLAGGIAHDFNNLLTVIMGYITLAKISIHDPDVSLDLLTKSEKASWQAKSLTQQLLTFARGGAPIKKTISIVNLITDSVDFTLSGSNIKCEMSVPEYLWPVDVDEGQLSQVINNLVINALQAMPEGGTIRVSAENLTVDEKLGLPLEVGKYVKIRVQDEGVGIPDAHFEKIFDPYFTTKPTGSGLGLATAYSIIKNHGGVITVDSAEGQGTSFDIYLPVSHNLPHDSANHPLQPATGQGRILVMDDEKKIREVVGRMLRAIGYEVTVTNNSQEAVESYLEAMNSGQKFDAVIMDLVVPGGMGGQDAIQKLLAIDPEVKAIVSSGYPNDPIMTEYANWGFKGVVSKPFGINELSQVLKQVLADD
ncbi:MAG: PAS domain S-box protein [Bacillota bacterium]